MMTTGIDSMDEKYMRAAFQEAEAALQRDDRPIGAVIVHREGRSPVGRTAFDPGRVILPTPR